MFNDHRSHQQHDSLPLSIPLGFQNYNRFGLPPGSYDQNRHQLSVQQHSTIGWTVVMQLLSALEVAASVLWWKSDNHGGGLDLRKLMDKLLLPDLQRGDAFAGGSAGGIRLPIPYEQNMASLHNHTGSSSGSNGSTPSSLSLATSLLFGRHSISSPSTTTDAMLDRSINSTADLDFEQQWNMPPIHCRTSFLPSHRNKNKQLTTPSLRDSIISGVSVTAEEVNVMKPKSNMYYNSGWVEDMSTEMKRVQRSFERLAMTASDLVDGGGELDNDEEGEDGGNEQDDVSLRSMFPDSKQAFYGIPASGLLRLFLPFEEQPTPDTKSTNYNLNSNDKSIAHNMNAQFYFHSIVVCEVNEFHARSRGDCHLDTDVLFTIGGIDVPPMETIFPKKETISSIVSASAAKRVISHYNKPFCVFLDIPPESRMTTKNAMKMEDLKENNSPHEIMKDGGEDKTDETEIQIGLALGIRVTNSLINLKKGACSVSHVIWQQQTVKQKR